MNVSEHLYCYAESLSNDLQKNKAVFISTVIALCAAGNGAYSSLKSLWYDEIFTAYLAELPSVRHLLQALLDGADLAPPAFHLITRVSTGILGTGGLGVRLPGILGFLTMSLCMFWFVSRRSRVLYAAVAMLLPSLTWAEAYSCEARPYGLVLGCSGLAVVSWQAAAEGRRRKLALLILASSIAVGVSVHYYAVLILGPLMLGEVARTASVRRLDMRIWIVLVVSAMPIAAHSSLIESATHYSTSEWVAPSLLTLFDFYSKLLSPAVLPATAMLVLCALCCLVLITQSSKHSRRVVIAWPIYEIVMAVGFVALPVFGVLAATITTGVFTPRYAMPAIIGVSILVCVLLSCLDGACPLLGVLFFLVLFGYYCLVQFVKTLTVLTPRSEFEVSEVLRASPNASLPIVVEDPIRFLPLVYYAPSGLAPRLCYVADVEEANRYTKSDSPDRALLALRRWAPIRVYDYKSFLAHQKNFLVYWNPSSFGWLLARLHDGGAKIEVKGRQHGEFLFFVEASP